MMLRGLLRRGVGVGAGRSARATQLLCRAGLKRQRVLGAGGAAAASGRRWASGSSSSSSSSSSEALAAVADDVASSVSSSAVSPEPLGYWPSDLVVSALSAGVEAIDLPAWAVVVGTTLFVRLVMVPLSILGARSAAKLAEIRPRMELLQEQMKADASASQPARQKMYRDQMAALIANGGNPLKTLVFPLSQLPIFMGFFFGLRKCGDYIPAFQDGGTLWFPNLTLADETLALPVMTSLLFLAMAEVGGDGPSMGSSSRAMKATMRSLAVIAVPLTMHESAGLFVYWFTNNFFSVTQGALMRHEGFRRVFNIPPLPKASESKGNSSMAVVRVLGGDNPFKEAINLYRERKESASLAEARVLGGGVIASDQHFGFSQKSAVRADAQPPGERPALLTKAELMKRRKEVSSQSQK